MKCAKTLNNYHENYETQNIKNIFRDQNEPYIVFRNSADEIWGFKNN